MPLNHLKSKFLVVFLVCFTLFPQRVKTVESPPNQKVTINRLTNLVSNFLTYAQWKVLCDTLQQDLWDGASWDTIKQDAMDTIMKQLSSSQYASVMAKGTTLIVKLGPSVITTSLNNLMTVLGNNLNPVYLQLVDYKDKLKAKGLQQTGVEKNVYRIVNSFASKKRVKTIFTRVSLKFSTKDWQSIVSSLNGVFQFSKNGF